MDALCFIHTILFRYFVFYFVFVLWHWLWKSEVVFSKFLSLKSRWALPVFLLLWAQPHFRENPGFQTNGISRGIDCQSFFPKLQLLRRLSTDTNGEAGKDCRCRLSKDQGDLMKCWKLLDRRKKEKEVILIVIPLKMTSFQTESEFQIQGELTQNGEPIWQWL